MTYTQQGRSTARLMLRIETPEGVSMLRTWSGRSVRAILAAARRHYPDCKVRKAGNVSYTNSYGAH